MARRVERDEIPAELLRAAGQECVTLLSSICVNIWQTGEWPVDWVRTVFVPPPTKGDLQQCRNYRTMSLSHSSKVKDYH